MDIDVDKLKMEYEKLKDENIKLKREIDNLKKDVTISKLPLVGCALVGVELNDIQYHSDNITNFFPSWTTEISPL